MIPGIPDNAEALQALSPVTTVVLGQGLVVFARFLGMMILLPFFGSLNIPMTARVGLAVVLATVVTPSVGDSIMLPEERLGWMYLALLVNQVLIGAMLGLVVAFTFFGIESAGRLIDNARGDNMSQIANPSTGDRSTPTGQWFMYLAVVLLVATGQHMIMLEGLIHSFTMIPATTSMEWLYGADMGDPDMRVIKKFAELSGGMMLIAVKIAAPTLLSVLLSDVLLGIINRGAPTVNVFMFSMPIKAIVGTAAVLVAFGSILTLITDPAQGTDPGGLFAQIWGNDGKGGHLSDMYELMNP